MLCEVLILLRSSMFVGISRDDRDEKRKRQEWPRFSANRHKHDNTTESLIWQKKSESVRPDGQLKTEARMARESVTDESSFGQ